MKNPSSKSPYIETLRGIAILLVVIGHVIGSTSSGGMKVDDSSFYRYLYCFFENIRMPLLTVISGWVYALHPIEKSKTWLFLRKKVRRLLFPMIFVGSTYYIIQYLTPGTNMKHSLYDIWQIYIFPYTFFWYLPALFLVFSSCIPFERLGLLKTLRNWSILMAISYILCFCVVSNIIPQSFPNIFAIKNALYLLPFFLLGVGLNKFEEQLANPLFRKIYLTGTIIGILLQQVYYFSNGEFTFYAFAHIDILIGMVSTAFLVYLKLKNPVFIWIAQYAYTIYLFHGFGTSGGRIILAHIGINNSFIIFTFATIIAIASAIIIEKVFINWTITRKLFLGKK